MRRILPASIANMRDIGGIYTKSGKKINYSTIIRSNLPLVLTKSDIEFLIKNGLTTNIDVRTKEEIKLNRNILNQDPFKYIHIEMKGANYPEVEEKIPQGYMEIIDDKSTVRRILEIISTTQDGVIINCSTGKDRTGVIVLILLLIANAYDEDIIADYQLTYTFSKKDIVQLHIDKPDLPVWVGHSKAEYMEETLRLFREKYGNINEYLQEIGLDVRNRNKIYEKLIKK